MPVSNTVLRHTFGLLFVCCSILPLSAQNRLRVVVRSAETKLPLAGASVLVSPSGKGGATDTTGSVVIYDLAPGRYEVRVSFVGFESKEKSINVLSEDSALEVDLDDDEAEMDSTIVVTATRSDRTIQNTPTRVEVIAKGEISENISMRPGEIRMLLNETTGLMTQPTSAVSGTADLKIQELDGRFTQLLKDGMPLYSGLSEGLSLVQIPPLDLRQVEIIKGPSSTLFGGGAITGLVNLVSKTPTDRRELNFLLNGTFAGGLDLSEFYAEKYGKTGVTMFSSFNQNSAYDPFNTGLSAIPRFKRFTLAPRLFFYGKRTTSNFGMTYQGENRLGGSMDYIAHGTSGYFESNRTNRVTSQLEVNHHLADGSILTFKNSFDLFHRHLQLPDLEFEGVQPTSFSELSWHRTSARMSWVAGLNYYTNHFSETPHQTDTLRNYRFNTLGAFVQNTWSPIPWMSVESGLRTDYTAPFGLTALPRISLLLQLSQHINSRIGGGLGYKLPTIFLEETEEQHYLHLLPLSSHETTYEHSYGGTADITYSARMGELKLSVNPLFFYTHIQAPLVLSAMGGGRTAIVNADGFTDAIGLDLSFRLSLNRVSFYTGYTYTVAQNHFTGTTVWYPLAPHDRLHLDLVYERESKIRIALETYYTSNQSLRDGTLGHPYWLVGALIEKTWKHWAVFINGEDLNDAHQSAWGPVYNGSILNPVFKDVYAPLEGRTINTGIKIKI